MKKFCKKCGQLIVERQPGFLGFGGKPGMKCYEFEEGFYCEGCAESKVNKSRGKK